MKNKYIALVTVMLFFGCKSVENNKTVASVSKIEVVETSEIASNLKFLSSDELMGRQIGTDGIDRAALYLSETLMNMDIQPYFETYRDEFEVNGITTSNIVGIIPGTDKKLKDEYVIIGAHYDHIGTSESVEGDELANGANDNASGCSAVLALAKEFSKANLKRSVLVVFFSAEESGLLGSIHLAKKLRKLNVYAMYNFEMLGVPMEKTEHLVYQTGIGISNMADKINEYAGKIIVGQLPEEMKYQLFRRSDNYSFYLEFNVPSHTVSTFDFKNYPYYHHVKDQYEFLESNHISNVVNELNIPLQKVINSNADEIYVYEK